MKPSKSRLKQLCTTRSTYVSCQTFFRCFKLMETRNFFAKFFSDCINYVVIGVD